LLSTDVNRNEIVKNSREIMECISLFLSIKLKQNKGGAVVEIIRYFKDSVVIDAAGLVRPYA